MPTSAEFGKEAVKTYVYGFVGAILILSITTSMLPTVQQQLSSIQNVPMLNFPIVGAIVGVGVLMIMLEIFL